MKHILKQRMIINESERSRIIGLHDNLRTNVGGFLHEQSMDEATKFFADQKTKFNNFPDGKVVPYGNTFGYEVENTDGTKYILLPNGSSAVNNGTGYKESLGYSWTKTPYAAQATTQGTATTQAPTTTQPTTQSPVSFENLATDKDLRQGARQETITKRKTGRQEQRDRKTRVKNCTSALTTYTNNKLDLKPDADPNKQQFREYFKANCMDLNGNEINLSSIGI
jgi:hypothetical protein